MDDQLTQVPEGEYVLRFEFHETKRIFKSEKIYLHFRIMNMGQHFEKPITGYYNCSIIGKPGRDGRFKAGWKSNLMREIVGLTGELPKRTDRLRLSPLKTMLVLGAGRERNQDERPARYPRTVALQHRQATAQGTHRNLALTNPLR